MEFKSSFFIENRKKLSKKSPKSLILIAANGLVQSSADLHYPFTQDSNFWYLTGIDQPDMTLLIDTSKDEAAIVLSAQNDYQKEWDGLIDKKHLTKISGIKKFYTSSQLEELVKDAIKKEMKICHLQPLDEKVDPYGFYSNPARKKLTEQIIDMGGEPSDIRVQISRLRQVKTKEEIKSIKKAINITATTLSNVEKDLGSFKTEKNLERAITAGFFANGADGHSYEPIIASGVNAATIHYTENSAEIAQNELLLLDVGAKFGQYTSDITRTWAVGKMSDRQKQVYDSAKILQTEAFKLLKPGISIREYQKKMEKLAQKEFRKLKISVEKYPHGFSHFMGLDVHDAGDYNQPLEPGVVMTVEPGIYIPEEGIGVRIEDDVLITKTGIENLSESIPKM